MEINVKNVFSTEQQQKIEPIIVKILSCIKRKNSIWIMGNGGSSSTADHFETDLSFIRTEKKIDFLSAQSLSANSALITAIANDIGFDEIFRHQLKRKSKKGDLVFLISASGNSQNLINAVTFANESGLESIGLLGFDGGNLLKLVSEYILIRSKIGNYGPVEDTHLAICHAIAAELMKKL